MFITFKSIFLRDFQDLKHELYFIFDKSVVIIFRWRMKGKWNLMFFLSFYDKFENMKLSKIENHLTSKVLYRKYQNDDDISLFFKMQT